jgi:hypothetical protein
MKPHVSGKMEEDILDIEFEAQLRIRAYEIWESEGRPDGREGEHWNQAVRELASLASTPDHASESKAPVKKAAQKPVAQKAAAAKPRRTPRSAQVVLN